MPSIPPDIFAGPPRADGASRGRIRAAPSIRPRPARLAPPSGCCNCATACGAPTATDLGHAARLKLLGPAGATAPIDFAGIRGAGPACAASMAGGLLGASTGRPIASRATAERVTAAGLRCVTDFLAARVRALANAGASPWRWRASAAKPGDAAMLTNRAIKQTIFKTRSLASPDFDLQCEAIASSLLRNRAPSVATNSPACTPSRICQ